jgi:hypothetical protein
VCGRWAASEQASDFISRGNFEQLAGKETLKCYFHGQKQAFKDKKAPVHCQRKWGFEESKTMDIKELGQK